MAYHTNNSRPAGSLIAGQYARPTQQTFAPSPPQQSGIAMPIPSNTVGIIAQQSFAKISAIMRKPLAKIVIATQQNRF